MEGIMQAEASAEFSRYVGRRRIQGCMGGERRRSDRAGAWSCTRTRGFLVLGVWDKVWCPFIEIFQVNGNSNELLQHKILRFSSKSLVQF